MPWWGYIACGIGLILFTTLFYLNRENPNVHFTGSSPKVVTVSLIVSGLALITIGIFGYFFPEVLGWVKIYSETTENLSNIYEILKFTVLQLIVVFGLFYTVIYKLIVRRKNSVLLLWVLILTVFSVICWALIFGVHGFDKFYQEPFRYFYKLIFR